DQESVVLRIEDRLTDVRPGASLHHRQRIPQGDDQELGPVSGDPPETEDAPVPGSLPVLAQAGSLEAADVLLGIRRAGGPSPGSCDHVRSPLRRSSGVAAGWGSVSAPSNALILVQRIADRCTGQMENTGAIFPAWLFGPERCRSASSVA